MKHFPTLIHTIIRTAEKKLMYKSFPLTLDHNPEDSELKQYFDYSIALNEQFSSQLSQIPNNEKIPFFSRNYREEALAYEETLKKILSENDVVAYSHRRGGWCTFEWNFNEDVKFLIGSNFGYGSASYLLSKFFYKDIQLTPYSKYVLYRYANYSELIRYTYNYRVDMSSWKKLIDEALAFYNAIESNSEHEIFIWLRRELNQMVSGLQRLMDSTTEFWIKDNENSHSVCVKGDELVRVKAEKISGSLDFIQNINRLPLEVSPQNYVGDLESLVCRFKEYAVTTKDHYAGLIENLDKEIEELNSIEEVSIYNRLRDRHYFKESWSSSNNKRKMIRYLLTLRDRLHIGLTTDEIRAKLAQINVYLDKRTELLGQRYTKKFIFETLEKALNKIEEYQKKYEEKLIA